jgi:hypothetical protein
MFLEDKQLSTERIAIMLPFFGLNIVDQLLPTSNEDEHVVTVSNYQYLMNHLFKQRFIYMTTFIFIVIAHYSGIFNHIYTNLDLNHSYIQHKENYFSIYSVIF